MSFKEINEDTFEKKCYVCNKKYITHNYNSTICSTECLQKKRYCGLKKSGLSQFEQHIKLSQKIYDEPIKYKQAPRDRSKYMLDYYNKNSERINEKRRAKKKLKK